MYKNLFILISLLAFYTQVSAQLVRDFRVNDDTTTTLQYRAMLGAADNGNFIVVWTDDRGTTQFNGRDYFQRFNASGKRIGNNVRIQTPTSPSSHAFTVRRDGSFVYAWADTSKCNIRIYDSTGLPISTDIIANDTNKFIRFNSGYNVSVSSDKNGNIITGLTYKLRNNDTTFLYIQMFDKYGNKKGANIKVNTGVVANNVLPDNSFITIREDGSFIITWQGNTASYGYDIYMQMFDSTGNRIGVNYKVNDDNIPDNFQYRPSISSDSIGNFIIVWEDARLYGGETPYAIFGQLFNPNGSVNGTNFLVDSVYFVFNEHTAMVSKRRDGNFVIGWNSIPAMETWRKPQCQRYNSLNQKVGGMINISKTAVDSVKKYISDLILVGNNIITVWVDYRGGIDTPDIYCNILSFTNPDSVVAVKEIEHSIPNEHKLFQNYPNPFNPNTTIKFQIKEKSFVTLKIFDILGRETETLVSEIKIAGAYETSFDASQLPSGIYFYTLSSDGIIIDTKKMFLVK